jgi:hypothetical protein
MKSRREMLGPAGTRCLSAIALGALGGGAPAAQAEEKAPPQKFLLVGLCGSENRRANFRSSGRPRSGRRERGAHRARRRRHGHDADPGGERVPRWGGRRSARRWRK